MMTNWDRLTEAGLTRGDVRYTDLSKEDRAAIDGLTAEEVEALIAIGEKLGREFLERNVFTASIFF